MEKYARVKARIRAGLCRKCINREFDLFLEPRDCLYYTRRRDGQTVYLRRNCPQCRQVSHMLGGVRLSRRYKVWFQSGEKNGTDGD